MYRLQSLLFAMALLLPLSSCATFSKRLPLDWHAQGVFLFETRLDTLREQVEAGTEPVWSAWLEVLEVAEASRARAPEPPRRWFVPKYYEDPEGHLAAKQGLQDDANAAYALALAYRMTDDPDYAAAAVRLLHAWATEVEELDRTADSRLSFSYHFPAFIFAADMLRHAPQWSSQSEAAFRSFVRESSLRLNTMRSANNWGNWGVVLVMAAGAYLDDRMLFRSAVNRWCALLDDQVSEDGHLWREVHRGGFGRPGDAGLWYSHFALMPQTLAAEIAWVNGVNLYDYTSPSGRELRQAFDWLAPYVEEPAEFPYFQGGDVSQLLMPDYASYFELLQARWPNPHAAAVLTRLRPMTARHSAPHLTFTHGQPLEVGAFGR